MNDDCVVPDGPGIVELRGYRMTRPHGRSGEKMYCHRVAWENETGQEVPPGYVLHHVCENRGCANPHHIALVSRQEHGEIHRELRHTREHPEHEPEWQFYPGRKNKIGCKVCRSEATKRWMKENPERYREIKRAYVERCSA